MTVQRTAMTALVLTMIVAGVATLKLSGAAAAQVAGDFRNAAIAEVVDAQGQPLLRGNFVAADGDDKGEVERVATLAATTAGASLSGEAEVEYQTDTPAIQEIELKASGLTAGGSFTLVIDGVRVGTATADKNGKAELEIEARNGAAQ